MSQVESSRKQVKEAVGATLDKVPAWSAVSPRTSVSRRKNFNEQVEQAELWPSSAQKVHRAESAVESPVAAPVIEKVPFVEVRELRPAAPVAVKPAIRRVAAAPATVIARGVPVQTIARFLNVNGAIEGMKSTGMRFDLPGRGLSQTLRLWRGTTETATYSTVGY